MTPEINKKKENKYDLEDRLIDFAVRIIGVAESLPNTPVGNHIRGQLIHSGTSPAPNYGEAQSAESRDDFIHKMKIALKELRETRVWLKIIQRINLAKDNEEVKKIIIESDELIPIFFVSIGTAKKNKTSEQRKNG